jgi:RNA polymerase sigma-70 factor (ECF subfamily)
MTGHGESGEVVELPAAGSSVEVALEELEYVYAFIYSRVGNRPDAEDLTQAVALKAIPRLRASAGPAAIRAYLFTTARSQLAGFWTSKLGFSTDELGDEVAGDPRAGQTLERGDAEARVGRILDRLPLNYRRLLELRFLRGYSLKEVAAELGSSVGAVKVMQLRALRAAARVGADA